MSGADETTHLPSGLQHFFKIVLGMEWPEGSEGGLKAISAAWSKYHDEMKTALEELGPITGAVDGAMDGVTAANIVDFMKTQLGPGFQEMMDSAAEFAKEAKNAAADIQKSKIMLIVMAAMALATVIELLATLFGAIFVPAVEAAARLTLSQIIKQLISKLSQVTFKQVLNATWKLGLHMGKWAAGGAAFMVTLDAGIQGGQIAAGDRDGFDTESLKGSAIGGAIGGAAGGAFHGLGKGIGSAFGKDAKSVFGKDFDGRFGKDIDNFARDNKFDPAKVRADLEKQPVRDLLSPAWQKVFNIGGPAAYALGQVSMVAASNPVVNIATGNKGNVWDGILSALSGPGGGKHGKGGGEGEGGGPCGRETDYRGQSRQAESRREGRTARRRARRAVRGWQRQQARFRRDAAAVLGRGR